MRNTINTSSTANVLSRCTSTVNEMVRAFIPGYLCLEHLCVGHPVDRQALSPAVQDSGSPGAADQKQLRTLSMVKPMGTPSGITGTLLARALTLSDSYLFGQWANTMGASGRTGQEPGTRRIATSHS